MPGSYNTVERRLLTIEEKESARHALKTYMEIIKDTAFWQTWQGGIRSRDPRLPDHVKTLIIDSPVTDAFDGFAVPDQRYYDLKGRRVPHHAGVCEDGTPKPEVEKYCISTMREYTKRVGKRKCSGSHNVPKFIYSQGRLGKNTPNSYNNKASYFTYEDDKPTRHNRCEFCGGKLERDERTFLYCTACSIIFE